jgi:NitT/TauT family transport system substrate-binding protein
MGRNRWRTSAIFVSGITIIGCISGCGLLGDPDSGGTPAPGSGLERSTLKVSVMPTIDLAPFHLAVQNEYFQAEGLKVEFSTAPSGPASVAKMISNEVDISYSSYTPFFVAKSQNAADIKIVADGSSAGPSTTMVLAMPNSSVKTIQDIPGKRIAVTAQGTISDLMTMSSLKDKGLDYKSIKWVTMPFPDMAARLQRGDVDAAFMTEPFIAQAKMSVGALPTFDTATGTTADLPTAGYGATAKFVTDNPKTVAAFQRVMLRATAEAKDRTKIEPLMVQFAKISQEVAASTNLLTFRSALDPKSLQRVPDLMRDFGVIPQTINVEPMIVPTPAN